MQLIRRKGIQAMIRTQMAGRALDRKQDNTWRSKPNRALAGRGGFSFLERSFIKRTVWGQGGRERENTCCHERDDRAEESLQKAAFREPPQANPRTKKIAKFWEAGRQIHIT